MTPAEIMKLGEELARRTTGEQRLPLKVDDPRTVERLAEMFGPRRKVGSARKAAS